MALLSPDIETINKLKQRADSAELMTLNSFLELPDDYEIYFQPYLNGDRPDMVIMKKNGGVLIIEVKDLNLDAYKIDENKNWVLKSNGVIIDSPVDQISKYKNNLLRLNIPGLAEEYLKDPKIRNCIQLCLVFPRIRTVDLRKFLLGVDNSVADQRYKNKVEYCHPIGYDALPIDYLIKLMYKTHLSKKSLLFNDRIYDLFHRHLQAPVHQIEEGKTILYTKVQKKIIEDNVQRRKIKGPAGSGKTLVLARKAVNAFIREGGPILILTYNITLVNYIRDRISDIKEKFPWGAFHIINYHNFFKAEANNYGIKPRSILAWDNENYFEPVKDQIKKYHTILIDEVQDYKSSWLKLLVRYFLKENGEFFVFGDEKQNIYDLPLDENRDPKVPTIRGKWNRSLRSSHRFRGSLSKIADQFQKAFFQKKYNIDDSIFQPEIEFLPKKLEYYIVDDQSSAKDFTDIITYLINDNHVHPGDVTILGSEIELLRNIDSEYRRATNEKTTLAFESQEEYEEICETSNENLDRGLESFRRYKKLSFYAKSGLVKMSTIHSFKGWESECIILIIQKNKNQLLSNEELIYVGLTRSKKDLFILNAFDEKYHKFFEKFEPE